jgi:hypothetical protein
MVTKEFILSKIRELSYDSTGKSIGLKKFCKASGISRAQVCGKYWAKWSDAVSEAGLKPNQMPQPLSTDTLCLKMAELITELGKFPSRDEINHKAFTDKTFPFPAGYRTAYGNRFVIAKAVLDYCSSHGGFIAATEICNAIYQSGIEEDEAYAKKYAGVKYFIGVEKFSANAYAFTLQLSPYKINQLKLERSIVVHQVAAENGAYAVKKLTDAYKQFHDPFTGKYALTKEAIKEIKKHEYMWGTFPESTGE